MALLIPDSVMARTNVVNVLDYGAVGDGVTDDTAAIQAAINAQLSTQNRYSSPRFIYFPVTTSKTYLISDTLLGRVSDLTFADGWRAGMIFWSSDPTVTIKLAANATGFGNPAAIKPMIVTGSESNPPGDDTGTNPTGRGNQGFAHGFYNLTFDLNGNAGAAAVDYHASNRGGIDNCRIISSAVTGVGILMTRDNPGPCLISNTTIEGCGYAVKIDSLPYSVTISNLTIRGQGTAGVQLANGNVAIEALKSYNNVVAVAQSSANGFLSMVKCELRLNTGQSRSALYGVDAAGRVEIQGLSSGAYNNLIRNTRNGTVTVAEAGLPTVGGLAYSKRFTTYPNKKLFNSAPNPLPVEQAPDVWSATAADWAVYGDYGGVGVLQQLQNTIDAAGRDFVCLPQGSYVINGDLYIRDIKKIIGFQAEIKADVGVTPTVYFDGASGDFTAVEHLYFSGCRLVHRSTKTLHVKHSQLNSGYENTAAGTGKLFFSDVISQASEIGFGQKAWARQLNAEFSALQLEITDATVWLCGFKTENNSAVAQQNVKATRSSLQVLGGVFYALGTAQNATTPKTPSLEFIDCQNVLASWNCFNASSGTHDVQVRETIGSVTRELLIAALDTPSPISTSYSGGTQVSQFILSASATAGSYLANGTAQGITGGNFAADPLKEENPFGLTLVAGTGVSTITTGEGLYIIQVRAASTVPSPRVFQTYGVRFSINGGTSESAAGGGVPPGVSFCNETGFLTYYHPNSSSFTITPQMGGNTDVSTTGTILVYKYVVTKLT